MCKGILNTVLWGVLFFISSYQIQAQVLLDKLLNNKPAERIKTEQVSQDVSERIKRHQQEIFMMQSAGKSPGEINDFMNARLKKSGTGSISGTVYEKDGITPLTGMGDIYVYDLFGEYAGYDNIYDGTYSVTNLNTGKYFIRASARMYRSRYYNNADDLNSATLVSVEDAQETDSINFNLYNCEGSISGYVRNKLGDPLPNCVVFARNTDYMSSGFAMSDSSGFYKIEYLGKGYYHIQVDYNGTENYVSGWYNGVSGRDYGEAVYVNEPYATDNINFVLEPGGAVAGRVLKPDGQPLEIDWYSGYVVLVNEQNDYVELSERDSTGNYFIGRIPGGNYKMYTNYAGTENLVTTWYPGRPFFETAEVITISPPDTLYGIDFNFLYGGAISGKVTATAGDSIIGPAGVILYDEFGNTVSSAIVEDDSYMINILPAGHYKIKAESQNLVPEWYNDKENYEDADFVEVTQNDTTGNINIALDRGGLIAGYVKSEQGTSVEGQIAVFDMDYNYVKSINVNGTYLITGLKPAYYKLLYSYFGDKNYAEQWYNGKHSFETAAAVYAAPELSTLTNFSIGYNGMVEVFVVDKDGKRVFAENSIMAILLYDAVTGELSFSTGSLGFTGAYRISTFYNDYKLSALLYHWNTSPQADSFAVSYYGGGKTFNDPASEIVSINGPGPVILENIVMEKMPGIISGSVYVEDEIFAGGDIQVVCYDESGYIAAASVYGSMLGAVDGSYKIHGLRPGKYYLAAGVYTGQPRYLNQLQWYGGIETEGLNEGRVDIPPGAVSIIVADGEVTGKDFHFGAFTGMDGNDKQEFTFRLEQNYPNPFNPNTTIRYEIPPVPAGQIRAALKIYDILGREITTLLDEEKPAGAYEITWNAVNISSGIYFYQLRAGEFVQTRKMILIK